MVLAGGRPRAVGELVLNAWGQPQPAPGWIAWAEDKSIEWPYRLSNVRWIDRTEMLRLIAASEHPGGLRRWSWPVDDHQKNEAELKREDVRPRPSDSPGAR